MAPGTNIQQLQLKSEFHFHHKPDENILRSHQSTTAPKETFYFLLQLKAAINILIRAANSSLHQQRDPLGVGAGEFIIINCAILYR
jgi:hypothetical protein